MARYGRGQVCRPQFCWRGIFLHPSIPLTPSFYGTTPQLSRVVALRSVICTAVNIHKSNFLFARRGQLKDLKCRSTVCWPGLRWENLHRSLNPWLVERGRLLPSPRTPPQLSALWASPPHPHFFLAPPVLFFLLKLCLLLAMKWRLAVPRQR